MRAICWSDYLCPWCYVGLDRAALLEGLGVRVVTLPFELHPDVPAGGHMIAGRAARLWTRIEAECAAVDLPFGRPERLPNTRYALEVAEVIRRDSPAHFPSVHRGLFDAHFARGDFIGDPDVVLRLVEVAGADVDRVAERVADGVGASAVDESMSLAAFHGVTATPAWLLGETFVLPGIQSASSITGIVRRLQAKEAAAGSPP